MEIICELGDVTEIILSKAETHVVGIKEGSTSYRILIVDDSETNRDLLKQLLSPIGFELEEATNGKEAIQQLENWKPDLTDGQSHAGNDGHRSHNHHSNNS